MTQPVSHEGKKPIHTWLKPETNDKLKALRIITDQTIERVFEEAIDDLARKYGVQPHRTNGKPAAQRTRTHDR
jgi:hypothetical protein